ncbi:cytochrome P450 [Auriscalpium vulgare]|uniref:Cytochrome P450 n=1 Tax=Auriscalpium vulgare TaxID=40419 RepID=A0ACB8RDR8_9AGAM|nr:cytochrome P450 [Auriscalpium vulgare]
MADLFERRGSKYSGRIVPAMLEMSGYNAWFLSAMQPNSPSWRTGRRSLDRRLRPKALIQYQPTIEKKAREFVKRLLVEPDDFVKHIQLLAGGSIMAIAYGQNVQNEDDELLQSARAALNSAAVALMPGGLLINDLPFLRHIPAWVPYLSYRPIARDAYKAGQISLYRPWNTVKDELVKGTAQQSVAREELLEHQPFNPGDEFNIAGAISTMFAETFFLMLALYPDVQARAQAELDAITGGERLPSFTDRPALPYIEAVCKEILRWKVAVPIGVPHATSEDDIFDGYFIPKGTLVIANAWSILHDPVVYPDPEIFNPERFLTDDGQFKDDLGLTVAFGGGKRICPGRFVVEDTLFISTATVLSLCTVGKKGDSKYGPLDRNEHTGSGLACSPQPFLCTIVPRSKKAAEMVMSAAMEASDQ